MKEKRLLLDHHLYRQMSQDISNKVLAHHHIQTAKIIAIYASLDKEVRTDELIETLLLNHRVVLPRVKNNTMEFIEIKQLSDLEVGHFGVREPRGISTLSPTDIDVMIVPLLAFDAKKYRVGYGKGYYDRYLSQDNQIYTIGLGFTFQEVESIDHDHYDIPLDEIMCE